MIIWAGDVQTLRDQADLESLACPPKYRRLGDFTKYWQKDLTAPALTIFIGGNHESSAHLVKLPFGGWVAPNMFYLGFSGVVQIKRSESKTPVRLAGLSGIYNHRNYRYGHFERPPFDANTIRSVYHVREVDVARLSCVDRVDGLITHDWPSDLFDLVDDADVAKDLLLRKKPYFREDIANRVLGNPTTSCLLSNLQPKVWCAAHLHVNYNCIITHLSSRDGETESLRPCLFLTHDKPKAAVATSIWDSDENEVRTPFGKSPIKLAVEKLPPVDGEFRTNTDVDQSADKDHPPAKRAKVSLEDTRIFVDLEWLLILRRTHRPGYFKRACADPIDRSAVVRP